MPGPGVDPGTGGYGRLRRPEGWPPYGQRERGIFPVIKGVHRSPQYASFPLYHIDKKHPVML